MRPRIVAGDLLRHLRARGHDTRDSLLRQYVRPWCPIAPAAEPADRSSALESKRTPTPTAITTRDVTRWICTRPEDLEDDQATAPAGQGPAFLDDAWRTKMRAG